MRNKVLVYILAGAHFMYGVAVFYRCHEYNDYSSDALIALAGQNRLLKRNVVFGEITIFSRKTVRAKGPLDMKNSQQGKWGARPHFSGTVSALFSLD